MKTSTLVVGAVVYHDTFIYPHNIHQSCSTRLDHSVHLSLLLKLTLVLPLVLPLTLVALVLSLHLALVLPLHLALILPLVLALQTTLSRISNLKGIKRGPVLRP